MIQCVFRAFLICGAVLLLRPVCAQYNDMWSQICGAVAPGFGGVVATDHSTNIFVAGVVSGDLNGQTNSGSNDLVLLKYNSTGSRQWTRLRGSIASDVAYGGE